MSKKINTTEIGTVGYTAKNSYSNKKSQSTRVPILEAPDNKTVNGLIDGYNKIIAETRQFTGIESLLETVIRLPQYSLKDFLYSILCGFGYDVVYADGYLFAKGNVPVMLCAHMDTVHDEDVNEIFVSEQGKLWSPQGIGGDDRCGIFTIVRNLRTDIRPYILFTENEEIGCVGAKYFTDDLKNGVIDSNSIDINFIIEIDRKGSNDSVYYDCDNPEFEAYISKFGFKTSWGSCSDISYIAPALGAAAVNLSSGYYNAHTLDEYIVLSELYNTISRVSCMVNDAANGNTVKYKYIEKVYRGSVSKLGNWYGDFEDDWCDDFGYGRRYGQTEKNDSEETDFQEFEDDDYDCDEMTPLEDGVYLVDASGHIYEPEPYEYYIDSKDHVFKIVDTVMDDGYYRLLIVRQINAYAYDVSGLPYKYDPNFTETVYIKKEEWSCTK